VFALLPLSSRCGNVEPVRRLAVHTDAEPPAAGLALVPVALLAAGVVALHAGQVRTSIVFIVSLCVVEFQSDVAWMPRCVG
jgi:hypothetical protein